MKVFPISLPSLAGVLLSLMVAAAPAQVPTFSKGFSPGTVGPGGTRRPAPSDCLACRVRC